MRKSDIEKMIAEAIQEVSMDRFKLPDRTDMHDDSGFETTDGTFEDKEFHAFDSEESLKDFHYKIIKIDWELDNEGEVDFNFKSLVFQVINLTNRKVATITNTATTDQQEIVWGKAANDLGASDVNIIPLMLDAVYTEISTFAKENKSDIISEIQKVME